MNHLDEGTIHAWLDGALDSTQAGEIEAHVAQCAACSTAVAEARGFVAGASRILNALDDVPANVLPKRAPVLPPASSALPPAKRQWRAAPWVTGIAAALMLAVGLTQVREGKQENMLVSSDSPPAAAASGLADSFQRRTVPALPPAQPSVRPPSVANAPEGPRRAKTTAPTAQSQIASGPAVQSQTAPNQSIQKSMQKSAQMKLDEVVVTAMPLTASPLDRAVGERSEADRLAGCYRVPKVVEQRGFTAAAGAGQVAAAARVRDRAAAHPAERVAGPSVVLIPPEIVRLDTARHQLGYVVSAAPSDSSVGTWTRVLGDSAQVDLLAAGLFKIALKDKLRCPDR